MIKKNINKIISQGLLSFFVILSFAQQSAFSKEDPFKNLQEFTVQRGAINVTVSTTGTVEPQNRLEIKPPIAGRVEEILVNEGDFVSKGQLLAWMSSSERAALLDAARAKGDEEYKKWQEYYKATPIYSPIDGMVILRDVEPGQTFAEQEAVFVLSDRLAVKAQVDETDLGNVKLDQETTILLDAYPKNEIKGKVVHIAYESTIVNNVTTFLVDVIPNEATDLMRSGMTANVTFYIENKENLIVIPESALKYKGGFPLVQKKDKEGKIIEQPVIIGQADDKNVEIKEGLEEGDKIYAEKKIVSHGDENSGSPFMPFGKHKKK